MDGVQDSFPFHQTRSVYEGQKCWRASSHFYLFFASFKEFVDELKGVCLDPRWQPSSGWLRVWTWSPKRGDLPEGQVFPVPGDAHLLAVLLFCSHPNITADTSSSCLDSWRGGCVPHRVIIGYSEKETCQGIIFHSSQPGALWEGICAVSEHPCFLLSGTISSGAAIPETNPGEVSVLQVCLPPSRCGIHLAF